jgi:hypothetical protein
VALQAFLPMRLRGAFPLQPLTSGLVACAIAFVLAACNPMGGKSPLAGPWPDLGAPVVVHIQNSTAADFYGAGRLVPVGSNNQELAYFKDSGASTQFDIARGGTDASNAVRLARVVFRILKYPTGSSQEMGAQQHVTITVTEPSASVFAATTLDTAWIEIVSVTPLP